MRTVTLPYYVDTRPAPDKTPAPETDIERFMAANLFPCQLLAARITARQCQLNRTADLYVCGKCDQARPDNKTVKLAKRVKRHKGDNPESPWRSKLYDRVALGEFEAEPAKTNQSGSEPVIADQSQPEPVKAEGRGQRAEAPVLDLIILEILGIMAARHKNEQAHLILKGGTDVF